MHLGNIRVALINYLFARQHEGTFVIRVEDTDEQRNSDPQAAQILKDLAWLGIQYDEGPVLGGPYGPYFQSERNAIYTESLNALVQKDAIYPCFCSSEELEKRRQRQLALKQPPRYDRTCLALSKEEVQNKLSTTPFIWRFKLDHAKTVSFYDLAHKTMHFELRHFSDIPLTRQDGSFTFLFANFVDDVGMKITHVFRGEDHLTNTAAQIALYNSFNAEVPVFCHLPILCNLEGKKLSKRDFGFSLTDLQKDGFLPEALINYLGILGRSVPQEILSVKELIESYDFEHLTTTGQIKYDPEKLFWINNQWIMRLSIDDLVRLCRPFIAQDLPNLSSLNDEQLKFLISLIQKELTTLKDVSEVLSFIPHRPQVESATLAELNYDLYKNALVSIVPLIKGTTPEDAVALLRSKATELKLPIKDIFSLVRVGLTGKTKGPMLLDILKMISFEERDARLEALVSA